MRIDIAIGEQHLLLSLFGNADSSHGHVGLARLHGRYLRSEVHNEILQLPVTSVGPFRQQFRFQTRWFPCIDEIERRHGRIGGHTQYAPRAALLGDFQGRGVVGIAPTVQNLLVGTVTAYFGQKTVKVLLQFGIVKSVAGSNRNRRKSCAHRIHLFKQLLVEHQRKAFTACRIYLTVLQGRQQIGLGGHAQYVGTRSHIGNGNVLYAADNHCHILAVKRLESGRNV